MENEKTSLISKFVYTTILILICLGCGISLIAFNFFDTIAKQIFALVAYLIACITISWIFFLVCKLEYMKREK